MNIGKVNEIPLNEDTAYLAGVVIGDGNLADSFKSKNGRSYKVQIQVIDHTFISAIAELLRKIVPTKAQIRKLKVRPRCQQTWSFSVSNKSLWYFLTKKLGVPCGAKSRKVVVPCPILIGDKHIKKAFLAGLFDADGGLRSSAIGLTTASETLGLQVKDLFRELDFDCSISSWVIKDYHWRYYGIRLRNKDIDRFLKEIPMKDMGKVNAIKDRFSRRCRSGLTGQKALEQV